MTGIDAAVAAVRHDADEALHVSGVAPDGLGTAPEDREALSRTPTGLSEAARAQAERVAQARARLLATPTATVESIAATRGCSLPAARQWLSRQRKADRLFTVTYERDTLVPGFLLADSGDTFPEMAAVIGPLRRSGMDGWALWVWFDSPSSRLDGERPVELVAQRRFDELAVAAVRDAGLLAA